MVKLQSCLLVFLSSILLTSTMIQKLHMPEGLQSYFNNAKIQHNISDITGTFCNSLSLCNNGDSYLLQKEPQPYCSYIRKKRLKILDSTLKTYLHSNIDLIP